MADTLTDERKAKMQKAAAEARAKRKASGVKRISYIENAMRIAREENIAEGKPYNVTSQPQFFNDDGTLKSTRKKRSDKSEIA